MAGSSEDDVYLLIGNIPKELHSSDLRAFFSQFVEKGAFSCFHYRHRPEAFQTSNEAQSCNKGDETVEDDGNEYRESEMAIKTCCCFVKIKAEHTDEFVRHYHGKHWSLPDEQPFKRTVRITKVRLPEHSDRVVLSSGGKDEDALHSGSVVGSHAMIELNPPQVMPRGNVGTPTDVFIKLINSCKLPTKVIKKLKLEFPKSRAKRRYGAVGHDYGPSSEICEGHGEEEEHETTSDPVEVNVGSSSPLMGKRTDPPSDDDEQDAEEWERYEALHSDVDKQERTKPRLFENEMEVVWEKGGSGLVFYTDTNFWKEQDGDSDEPDEWDLDLGCYYDPSGGDKDSKDLVDMDRGRRLRKGKEVPHPKEIGGFERHTKGFGKRMLKKSGWEEGMGLGRSQKGISEPVESDGQFPSNKSGIGYYGQKLSRDPKLLSAKRPKRGEREVMISTVYDCKHEEEDTLLRSAPQTTLKYRDKVVFKKGSTLHQTSNPSKT